MDSMRTLNTSLPRRRPKMASTDLHQAFKAAAHEVARLYMTATSDSEISRAAGYQDAIEDLLEFLDQESLGLQDGEGWRVRQWATERHSPGVAGGDSDDDGPKEEEIGAESPEVNSRQPETIQNAQNDSSMVTSPSGLRSTAAVQSFHAQTPPRDTATDRENQSAPPTPGFRIETIPAEPFSFQAVPHVHLDFQPRNRSRHILKYRKSHPQATPADVFGTLGAGSGAKRKLPYSEFFDINTTWPHKDGNKRGRVD